MANPLPIVQLDSAPGIYVLTLEPNQGPMVVLDEALIGRIEASLTAFPQDAAGMILASGSPRVFVAGADLKQIEGLDGPGLERYLAFGQRVFGMISRLPCATAAAINGAALGGGLELAMHCDGLVAARAPMRDGQPGKPYMIGLPEAGLSICPGWGGTNLMPARMDAREAIQRTAEGRPMSLDEAVAARFIDVLAPSAEGLIPTAAKWLREHGSAALAVRRDGFPSRWIGRSASRSAAMAAIIEVQDDLPKTDAAAAVVRAVRAGLEQGWPGALEVERKELNRLRYTDAGRSAIRAFFEKSAKK